MIAALAPCELDLMEHYPGRAERLADKWVHLIGLGLALVGGVVLFASSWASGGPGRAVAVALYALCLISMLGASTAYNLSGVCKARPLLRRMDEAAIFLMIAGSYTPFTTQRFEGGWAVTMTALVWTLALAGVAGKLLLPPLNDKVWAAVYALFGWVALIMIKPLITGVGALGILWLAAGGLIYTAGVLFFLNKRLRFRRAVWHGFVVVAAAVHYGAILTFVGLAPA
jgi:hemolysin III